MKILIIIAAIILSLHGLIHLLGTVTYWKLGMVQGLTYKTTLLGDRWNVGEAGVAVYGTLWALAAIGFLLTAVALLAGWEWYRPVLISVAVGSLVITALNWKDAYIGAILNILILIILLLGPNISRLTAR
ncbi:MAG: ABC transporter permease [Anaerolineales bacterium]|nr:ABC transporter permease [Anaerolineales bacterium]